MSEHGIENVLNAEIDNSNPRDWYFCPSLGIQRVYEGRPRREQSLANASGQQETKVVIMRLRMKSQFINRTCLSIAFAVLNTSLFAQDSLPRYGQEVPTAVRLINKRGLGYLKATQEPDGTWSGSQSGPGVTGICIMAMLASGEDPDFGPYSENIRKAVRNIIANQSGTTGHISGPGHGAMYHHGFATLALSEAYGVVNERLLWKDTEIPADKQRSIGQALELAVRCILTSQKNNPWKAWRYQPSGSDADTTVSGTVLMGLLGARNAGVEVPNAAIDNALSYFKLNTMADGDVSYKPTESHGNGLTRTAIATLVFAIAKRKDSKEYMLAAKSIATRKDQDVTDYPFYGRYYMAQALFHSDLEAWRTWNQRTIKTIQSLQGADGGIPSNQGKAYGTGMSVLALALNYRLLPVSER